MKKLPSGPIIYVVALLLLAAGCHRSGDPSATSSTGTNASVAAVPRAGPGITIASPRLVLPAVSGRPGAVYFTAANTGDRTETLVGVAVRGARDAQMHETTGGTMAAVKDVAVPGGGSVTFAPGGRHVMVFGLPTGLRPGGTSTLTLTFADGRSVSVPLSVLAPGTTGHDDMAGMTMDH